MFKGKALTIIVITIPTLILMDLIGGTIYAALSLVKVLNLRKAGKVILALAALLTLASVALAQLGDGYDLPWWAVGGGGRESAGGDYTLIGTIGQPDAGVLTGGNYTLVGGFWSGEGVPAEPETHPIYLPLILRQYP